MAFGQIIFYLLVAIFAGIGYLIADYNETAKLDSAKDYYIPLPKDRNSAIMSKLVRHLGLSVLISAIGLGAIGYYFADKTNQITSSTNHAQDSVRTQYAGQIESLNQIIQEQKERQKSSSKWTRYHANKDLSNAESQKLEILKLQKSDLSEIKTESKKDITSSKDLALQSALVAGVITLLLELFYIWTFKNEYHLRHKIELESQNHNFSSPAHEQRHHEQPPTLESIAVQMLVSQIAGANPNLITNFVNTDQRTNVDTPTANAGNVGFQFGQSNVTTQARNNADTSLRNTVTTHKPKDGYPDYSNDISFKGWTKTGAPKFNVGTHRNCDNCQKSYLVNHWSKRFCGDNCRMDYHDFDLRLHNAKKK